MDSRKVHMTETVNPGKTSKLRYPLRSGTKSKEPTFSVMETSNSRTKRINSSVSKSVSVLQVSATAKAKAPNLARSSVSPIPRLNTGVTPISVKRTPHSQPRYDASETTKSATRRKFSVLSSVSYWTSQIKLSESAGKHSISLGFFKLALESGCEPLQRLSEDLNVYVRKHNLLQELETLAKEILELYSAKEVREQVQISETKSHGIILSDSNGKESSPGGKLKQKPLISGSAHFSKNKENVNKANVKSPANRNLDRIGRNQEDKQNLKSKTGKIDNEEPRREQSIEANEKIISETEDTWQHVDGHEENKENMVIEMDDMRSIAVEASTAC